MATLGDETAKLVVAAIAGYADGLGSLLFVGSHTYSDALRVLIFVTASGDVEISGDAIVRGSWYF